MGVVDHRFFKSRSQNCKKAAISFVMSVRPTVRMEQLGPVCTDFH